VTMTLPLTSFQSFPHGAFVTIGGDYGVNVGQSSSSLPVHLHVTLR